MKIALTILYSEEIKLEILEFDFTSVENSETKIYSHSVNLKMVRIGLLSKE